MRDIALTLFVFGLLPVVLMQPYVGTLLWAWLSFMIPHRLAFGFAHTFPFAYIVAVTTLIGLFLTRERTPFPRGPMPVILILFIVWMSITSLFAMGPWEEVYAAWLRMIKIHLMLFVTMMLIRSRERIEPLIWVIVLSIGYYGVKGGIWTVLRGGGEKVWGPPGGVIEGNNELALALVMIIPLMCYLMSVNSRKVVKLGLLVAIVTCGFSILGSHSRGAFLAIIAMAGMLAMKSRRPILLGALGAAVLIGMFSFMPEHWTARMHTIETYEDGSASNRLYTWRTLFNMALDRPIVGAGFEIAIPEIFQKWGIDGSDMKPRASHSIYLQALGEHGFVGLGIFLALMLATWRRATHVSRICRGITGLEWVDSLMRMTQVSLVGFAVGGAFLSLLHFDLPYYLMGLVVMAEAVVKGQAGSGAPQPGAPQAPAPPRTERGQPQATRSAFRW